MDIFQKKSIKPMLIGENQTPFDSPDWIYELKLDGIRCVVYLDETGTELRNKRNMRLNAIYPELSKLHKQVSDRCILDGELVALTDGKPDFSIVQRRALLTDRFKIELAAKQNPVSFTAFDILYFNKEQITSAPLIARKETLAQTVSEGERLVVSRFIAEKGVAFYQLTEQNDLEGIVAKRKDSHYYFDKTTKDWIKIKYLKDDDFVVCGYIHKDNNMTSIVLGQYSHKGDLLYKGHVTFGVSGAEFQNVQKARKASSSPFISLPSGNENATWLRPELVCTVKYMEKTENGSLRQPVFKGLRQDKAARDCISE